MGTQLLPGVVQGLVERAAGGALALGEHVDRHAVERERDEDVRWRRSGPSRSPRGSPRAGRPARRPRPARARGSSTLRLERAPRGPATPGADLHGRLEQRELVRPGREPAPALEVVQAPEHRDGRVGRRFLRDLGELAAAEVGEGRPAPRDLEPRSAQGADRAAAPRPRGRRRAARRARPATWCPAASASSWWLVSSRRRFLPVERPEGEARRPRLAAVHRLGVAPGDGRARRPARLRLALDVGPPVPDRRRPGRADLRGLPDPRRLGRAHRARRRSG